MKRVLFTIVLLGTFLNTYSQSGTIDLKQIKVNNIPFITSLQDVTKQLGPNKISTVDDACGFFSVEWTDTEFFRYFYPNISFIGNHHTGLQIEKVDFSGEKVAMTYEKYSFNNQTTLQEFSQIFKTDEPETKQNKGDQTILIHSKETDDGAQFYFKDGKLIGFEYFNPC